MDYHSRPTGIKKVYFEFEWILTAKARARQTGFRATVMRQGRRWFNSVFISLFVLHVLVVMDNTRNADDAALKLKAKV